MFYSTSSEYMLVISIDRLPSRLKSMKFVDWGKEGPFWSFIDVLFNFDLLYITRWTRKMTKPIKMFYWAQSIPISLNCIIWRHFIKIIASVYLIQLGPISPSWIIYRRFFFIFELIYTCYFTRLTLKLTKLTEMVDWAQTVSITPNWIFYRQFTKIQANVYFFTWLTPKSTKSIKMAYWAQYELARPNRIIHRYFIQLWANLWFLFPQVESQVV